MHHTVLLTSENLGMDKDSNKGKPGDEKGLVRSLTHFSGGISGSIVLVLIWQRFHRWLAASDLLHLMRSWECLGPGL